MTATITSLVGCRARVSTSFNGIPVGTKVKIVSVRVVDASGWSVWVAREDDKQPSPTLYSAFVSQLAVEAR